MSAADVFHAAVTPISLPPRHAAIPWRVIFAASDVAFQDTIFFITSFDAKIDTPATRLFFGCFRFSAIIHHTLSIFAIDAFSSFAVFAAAADAAAARNISPFSFHYLATYDACFLFPHFLPIRSFHASPPRLHGSSRRAGFIATAFAFRCLSLR